MNLKFRNCCEFHTEMIDLEFIEKRYNIIFPEQYKKIYSDLFKYVNKRVISKDKELLCIMKYLNTSEIYSLKEDLFELMGYDIVPLADMGNEDYICFNFGKIIPSIDYWSYDLAMCSENAKDAVTLLFDSFEDFFNSLCI